MRVLVACEFSQIVTKAFRDRGHHAMSLDLLQTQGNPDWHLQMDIRDIWDAWDLIIAFPPCTDLAASGAPSWKVKQADGRQQRAIELVKFIWDFPCERIAIENPTGILNTVWRKPDQIINPFQFGEPYRKRTCLWLKGLPKLTPTNIVEPEYHWTSNSTRGGLLKDGTRKKSELPIRKAWDNWKERSKTFQGIANAMAEQWG